VNKENEYSNILSKSLIDSPIICHPIIKHVSNLNLPDLQDSNTNQVSFASSEREVKTFEEKGEHQKKIFNSPKKLTHSVESKNLKNQLSSPELFNISNIPKTDQQTVSQDVSVGRCSIAEDLDISNLSNTHHCNQEPHLSLPPCSARIASDIFVTSTPQAKQAGLFSKKGLVYGSNNFITKEVNSVSGILDDNSLILGQRPNEQETEEPEKLEVLLQKIREDNDKKIEDLKVKHQAELEYVKASFEAKQFELRENHKKELEDAVINSKNKANETISHLNKQIILERSKMFAEQQNNSIHLENEFQLKEERLTKSLFEVEEREQAWQDDKADVLDEVQRLKAEATRMVKILAMEYEEEENMSEDKKRSLGQEVYSLQLVVEMRTEEVRNLREKLATATQHLEQAEIDKQKLKKVTVRMEDLEEQLKIKSDMQNQLSLEKDQLEIDMTNTSKEVDRMSKNVEALQWRIRNHFDVPVEGLITEYQDHQRASLQTTFTDQQTTCTEWITKHLISEQVNDNKATFPSDEAIKATTNENVDDSDTIKELEISIDKSDDWSDVTVADHDYNSAEDVDSLDEGVGDISSDGESPDSLEINKKESNDSTFSSDENIETQILATRSSNKPNNLRSFNTQPASPSKERIPSRF